MKIKSISKENITVLTALMLKLWTDCNFEEEYRNCQKILRSDNETCFLIKNDHQYIGFIQMALRLEHIEGATTSPVGYVEGIYIEPDFQEQGLGRQLMKVGEQWAKSKGCTQIGSDVELTNPSSILFHKKVGFQEVNRIACFVKNIK